MIFLSLFGYVFGPVFFYFPLPNRLSKITLAWEKVDCVNLNSLGEINLEQNLEIKLLIVFCWSGFTCKTSSGVVVLILTCLRNKSGSGLTSRSDTESVQKELWSHDIEDEMWTGGLQKLIYRSQLLGAPIMTFKKNKNATLNSDCFDCTVEPWMN